MLTGNYDLPLIISLDFSIHRLSYLTLFMSTTVCSSPCRRYSCSNFIIYFAVFQLLHVLAFIQWQPFTYTTTFLLITIVLVYLQHISSPRFAIVHFAFASAPYSGFFKGFVIAFLEFFRVGFKRFSWRSSVFQQFQYYLLYICIILTWYISTSGSYITCTYTDNSCYSLIYCSNFLME